MKVDGDDLPNPSRVVRYVPFGKMRKDEDDNFLGPLPSAFEEREVDDYLSVTWCEYFEGSEAEQLRCAVEAKRSSNMDVKPRACFCFADTSDVLSAIGDFGGGGRAIYHPEDDNAAHSGIYGISPEEWELTSLLADEVWCEFLTKKSADELPLGECQSAEH